MDQATSSAAGDGVGLSAWVRGIIAADALARGRAVSAQLVQGD